MSTDADRKKRSRMAEDEDQRAERLLKNKVRMQHQREEGRVLNTLADEFDLKMGGHVSDTSKRQRRLEPDFYSIQFETERQGGPMK